MSLTKVPYTNGVTVIGAENLNDIQDSIIGMQSKVFTDNIIQALLQIAEKVAYIDSGGATYYQALYNALNHVVNYTVTNTLTGCTSSNSSASVTSGSSYSATITASSGYTLTGATVSVTMGGNDITSTAYNGGTISIASVSGNISITVTAVQEAVLSSISAEYTQSGTVYTSTDLDDLKSDLVVTATYSDTSTATVASTDYTLSGTLTVGTSTITVSYGGKTTTFTVTVSDSAYLFNWDLTSSLVDSVGGREIQLSAASGKSNATRSSSGLSFNDATQIAYLGTIPPEGKTFEFDISSFSFAGDTSKHIRLMMNTMTADSTFGAGSLIYKSSTGWSSYGCNGVTMNQNLKAWSSACWSAGLTGNTDAVRNSFNGKTVKIVFDSDGHTKSLYIDGNLEGTQTDIYFVNRSETENANHIFIGGLTTMTQSSGDQCYNMTITGIRVYNNA